MNSFPQHIYRNIYGKVHEAIGFVVRQSLHYTKEGMDE